MGLKDDHSDGLLYFTLSSGWAGSGLWALIQAGLCLGELAVLAACFECTGQSAYPISHRALHLAFEIRSTQAPRQLASYQPAERLPIAWLAWRLRLKHT